MIAVWDAVMREIITGIIQIKYYKVCEKPIFLAEHALERL